MGREVVTGYCWPQSVRAGEQVGLHLSSSGGRPVRVEVARVGGRREVVFSADAVAADEHETPKDASSKGCGWPVALTLDVDPTWRSGYYEVVMEIDVGEKVRRDHAFFVVRPSAGARIVLALATNTWHAYNDFGGPNLYTGGTHVAMQRPMAAGYLYKPPGKGRRVTGTGAPDPQNAAHVGYIQLNHLSGYAGSAGWPDWELPFIEWAEREGFEIGVCTNADLEEHPEVLDGASLYLSVGHDEYWSRGMRDTVEAFIARGGNAAFFSGNTSLWQVRIEGDDHDVMVGYKGFFKDDPLMETDREPEVTTFWSDVVVGRPENHMTGVSFTRGGYHRIGRNVTAGLGGYTVHRAGHWIFDGTGLGYGDVLGAGATVVGYECDGCVFTYRDGLPYPTGEDGTPSTFEILGTCPTQHFTRETAPRPPKPGEPSELEYIASRVFGTREPEAMERIRHGHAVLGAYTNDGGRDGGHVGVDRLGPRAGRARPADRADHPERADAAGVARQRSASPTAGTRASPPVTHTLGTCVLPGPGLLREAEEHLADDVALHLAGAAGDAAAGRAEHAGRRVAVEHRVGAGLVGAGDGDVEEQLGDAELEQRRGGRRLRALALAERLQRLAAGVERDVGRGRRPGGRARSPTRRCGRARW